MRPLVGEPAMLFISAELRTLLLPTDLQAIVILIHEWKPHYKLGLLPTSRPPHLGVSGASDYCSVGSQHLEFSR